jgi:hypothetical protein
MKINWSKGLAILAMLALFVACATELRAQDTSSMPAVPQQAAQTLTGDQQAAANSALCSAIGSHFPNPAISQANPRLIERSAIARNSPLYSAIALDPALFRLLPLKVA